MHIHRLHSWNLSPARAVALQRRLCGQLCFEPPARPPTLVAGVDVTYAPGDPESGVAGVVVLRLPDLETVEEVVVRRRVRFPYVPGLLSFREGPVALAAIEKLKSAPDLLLFDGQGLAHPRRFGLACHLGLWLNAPTIGCAKSLLCGTHRAPARRRGACAPLLDKGETVGLALRTRDGVNPVYVSVGHKMDLPTAAQIVLSCGGGVRIPEPTRRAHILVNREAGRMG